MKIVAAPEVSAQVWDEACDRSSRAWLFHRRSWIALEEQFFGHRSRSFAVVNETGAIGVQPLYLSEVGIGWMERLVHSGIHRHTGFATVDGLAPAMVSEATALAMRRILEIAADERADRIQLNTQNLAPVNRGPAREEVPFWVREYGFELGLNFGPNGMLPVPGMATCCADQVVALEPGEETLFGGLSESCRRAVRKAQKAGIVFEEHGGGAAEYFALARMAAERTGEQLPSPQYYEAIERDLLADRRCAFLFAMIGGTRVAALLLAIDKGAVSYLGGVSDPEYLPMRVNDFLHWSGMCWAKRRGCTHYRFGPAFPQLPADWPIARVSRFKEKFGADSVTTIQGSLFLQAPKYLAGGIEHLSMLCRNNKTTAAVSK
jgi:hypothetical protein